MNNKQYESAEIAQKIKASAKENGISVKQMLEEIGLAKGTLDNFKTSMPKADNLAKIADYLGVSVDYLLGREIKNAPDDEVRGDIIERIRSLSEADAEKLRILVETVFPDPDGE